jgi:hypothetical protein
MEEWNMTDAEKIDLALWCLQGPIWLGRTIKFTDSGEYVAVHWLKPYSAPEPIYETHHADPWECLALARKGYAHDAFSKQPKE